MYRPERIASIGSELSPWLATFLFQRTALSGWPESSLRGSRRLAFSCLSRCFVREFRFSGRIFYAFSLIQTNLGGSCGRYLQGRGCSISTLSIFVSFLYLTWILRSRKTLCSQSPDLTNVLPSSELSSKSSSFDGTV